MKTCSKCGEAKELDKFHANKKCIAGRNSRCIACVAKHYQKHRIRFLAQAKARLDANPELKRVRNLKRKFGISVAQYNDLSAAQGHVCAICRNPETAVHCNNGPLKALAVDHDHITNKIRGLLCFRCNVGIGHFKDDLSVIDAIRPYLTRGVIE